MTVYLMDDLATAVNGDLGLVRRGRWVSLQFVWGIGKQDYLVRLKQGRVMEVKRRALPIENGVFSVRASAEVWAEHWRPLPKPNYHDLFSMLSAGNAELDGEITPLMQNLLYFKGLLAAPRAHSGAKS